MRFTPVAGALGADVHGIDLGKPLCTQRQVAGHPQGAQPAPGAVFPRAADPARASSTSRSRSNFGEPEPTPFRQPGADGLILDLDQTDPRGSQAANFHADNTFRPEPPIGALLQAHVRARAAAATPASPRLSLPIEGAVARHAALPRGAGGLALARPDGGAARPRRAGRAWRSTWPNFRRASTRWWRGHPFTGRKLLNVNYNWTTHIDGIPAGGKRGDAGLSLRASAQSRIPGPAQMEPAAISPSGTTARPSTMPCPTTATAG